jgi:hypothetical protein
MGCCNDPSVTLAPSVQNPTLHVNYAKGMVLGVDDFTQEFAYLAGRDNWMVAELIGYGTTSGLAVSVQDSADGPQVRVSRGAAAVPNGKLVCVPADQCGVINKWLAKSDNAQQLNALIDASPPLSPPAGKAAVSLYLTLCYADCTTMPVPIPGEPCRSEDELMADSRIADDYKLEFRTVPPPQVEVDAVHDFVRWLKQVPVVDGSPPPAADEKAWIASLRAAAQPWFDAMSMSPPLSPPASVATLGDFMFDSPPTSLMIAPDQLCSFLRVAFRFWVTELRPFWITRMCGNAPKADDNCVLLAKLDVPIVFVGGSPTGAWQVDGSAADVAVDESRRPYLSHMQLLQEWLLCGCALSGDGSGKAPTFAGLITTGAEQIAYFETGANITLEATHHMVVANGPANQTITLPKCTAGNKGRVYIVRSTTSQTKLAAATGDQISTATATVGNTGVNKGNAITVVSDGKALWHVIATVA